MAEAGGYLKTRLSDRSQASMTASVTPILCPMKMAANGSNMRIRPSHNIGEGDSLGQ